MRPRILFCITVYNGRSFVPAAVASAMRLDQSEASVDVLVLDDCSPDPGWSEELEGICTSLGAHYYRTPRNLGIPRNVNLGLQTALDEHYDYVVINNSDVVFPKSLVTDLLASAAQPDVGSVTAWSTNVSVYSLPNEDPDRYLSQQDVVDWVAASLSGQFGAAAMDIPAGISFCILIPTRVLDEVGLMDPVFGRGYCEETDWSLRSLAMGYRITLCPGTFVYHSGSGSTHSAGLLMPGMTTVMENEAVIDLRYPQFRVQVRAFLGSGILEGAHRDAIRRIIADGGRQFGYTLDVGWLPVPPRDESHVQCLVAPEGKPALRMRFLGFEFEVPSEGLDVRKYTEDLFGREPTSVNVYEKGSNLEALEADDRSKVRRLHVYPTRI